MTFPTIPTAGASTILTSSQATATTTHTFPSLTTLAQSAGDLMIAVIVCYEGGSANAEFSSWGGSFTEFVDQSANSTTIQSIGAAYKFATGSETGTFTVTTVKSTRSAMFLMTIPGAHPSTPPTATVKADGTTVAADPAALDPAGWAAEDTLWIAVAANGEISLTGSFTGITAAPASYTNYLDTGIIGGDVIGAIEGAVAFRQLNAASENVGAFTLDVGAAGSSALTIAVRPAGAAALISITSTPKLIIREQFLPPQSRIIRVATPAGGGTVTQTDSVGLTDNAVFDQSKTQTDSVGLTDAVLLTRSLVQTDSAGLTDTSSVELVKIVTQTDSAGLADTALFQQAQTQTDSVGLTDTTAFTQSEVITDSAGLTDTSLVAAGKLLDFTDSAGLTDTTAFTQSQVITDSAGLTDAPQVSGSVTYNDSAGLTDTTAFEQFEVITDSAGLTDVANVAAGKLLNVTDSAGLTDTQVFNQARVHTDSAGLTDAAEFTISKVQTDSAGLTDTSVAGLQKEVTQTDSAGLTDTQLFSRTLGVEDLVGLTDAASFAQLRVFTDSTGLTDTAVLTSVLPVFDGNLTGGVRAGPGITGGRVLVGTLTGGQRG